MKKQWIYIAIFPVLWPQHHLIIVYVDLVQIEHDKSHPQ